MNPASMNGASHAVAVQPEAAPASPGTLDATAQPASPPAATAEVAEVPQALQGAEEAQPSLSFRVHMWDSFDFLWQRRIEPSRRLTEDFVLVLRERAQLERQYAKSLARSAARLQAHSDLGNMPEACEAVMVNMRNRAEQSLELASGIEQDVVETIEAMLRQHSEVSKQVRADGSRVSKTFQEARRVHEELAGKYAQACVEAEDTAKEYKSSVLLALPHNERMRRAARMMTLSRQATAVEREYLKAVQRLNEATKLHERQMGHVLGALQDMEEKRANCFKDSAMKLVVFDVSWLRNMQYDLEGAVKGIEDGDGVADVQKYIQQHQTQAPRPVLVRPQSYWELAAARQGSAPPSSAAGAHSQLEAEAAMDRHVEALRPLLRSLLQNAEPAAGGAAASAELANAEQLAELRRGLEGSEVQENTSSATTSATAGTGRAAGVSSKPGLFRYAFGIALQKELLFQVTKTGQEDFSSKIEDLPPVQVGPASFDTLVSLVRAALDGCHNESDAWNGRTLMVLCNKIQNVHEGKVVDILVRVYNHPLWGRVTFWEEMLYVAICEAQAQLHQQRRSSAPGTEFPEVVITPFLQNFMRFMVSWGIQQQQAQACVQRTCRKYIGNNAGSPMAEAYIEHLIKRPEATSAAAKDSVPSAKAAPGAPGKS